MFGSWIKMWKKTLNFKEAITIKEYWLAIIMNVIVMYIGVVPYALILRNFTTNYILASVVYMIAIHIPIFSLYFKRAKTAEIKLSTTIYIALIIPIISGIFVGLVNHCKYYPKKLSIYLKIIAFGMGVFFYGGVLGIIIYGDPIAMPTISAIGLAIMSITFIIAAIDNRSVIATFLSGELD